MAGCGCGCGYATGRGALLRLGARRAKERLRKHKRRPTVGMWTKKRGAGAGQEKKVEQR